MWLFRADWKPAAVMRIEMLHDYKRHARFRRQMAQEIHRRFESTCPPADAHNWADWFAVAVSDLAFALGNFGCGNFLPLVFIREDAALDIAFRFVAMRPFYVSLGLPFIQAAIVSVERVVFNALAIACGFAA